MGTGGIQYLWRFKEPDSNSTEIKMSFTIISIRSRTGANIWCVFYFFNIAIDKDWLPYIKPLKLAGTCREKSEADTPSLILLLAVIHFSNLGKWGCHPYVSQSQAFCFLQPYFSAFRRNKFQSQQWAVCSAAVNHRRSIWLLLSEILGLSLSLMYCTSYNTSASNRSTFASFL